ncbi:MAG: phenylacetate-CoA oxygenase/reductase subunit PaaK [Lewinellaceae bacterium]|nr:phenylacetate-CoA oxygenase/reductase subunit PaaK [Lewinellaceae bacterium]
MMSRFHTLNIRDVNKETEDCVSVAFDIPADLSTEFSYFPGQHLVLKTTINGEEIRRSYSICSSPSENELRVAIKQIESGLFSSFANTILKAGDQLEVMPPSGKFGFGKNVSTKGNYVAFAAGSGITPIISIIQSTLESNEESQFTLFYGNKTENSIIFSERLSALKNKFMNRLGIYHILSQENPGNDLFYGRINQDKCKAFCEKLIDPKTIDSFFICGPSDMTEDIRQGLLTAGVPSAKIHFELFTAPDQKIERNTPVSISREVFKVQLNIKIDNKSFSIESPTSDGTILEMASRAGHDLPFSCKGGVCCTCRAKLTEGEANMDVNYALEEDELESGYILTCQARPKSKKISVDFDA